jgi:hypothetical protein
MHNISIEQLAAKLEASGAEAMRGFMLDMHGGEVGTPVPFKSGDSMLTCSPFFLPDYSFLPSIDSPYCKVSGGFRDKAFSMNSRQTPLVKTPLIRAGNGIIFWSSSHKISPAKIAQSTCALLHFKFIGDFLRKAKTEIIRGQHASGALDYRRYVDMMSTPISIAGDLPMERFHSVQQLEKLGLIQPS